MVMVSSGCESPPSPPSDLDGNILYTRDDMGGSEEPPREPPILIHRFSEGKPVYGVQPIGEEIYIIRDSTPDIEVYDIGVQFKRILRARLSNLFGTTGRKRKILEAVGRNTPLFIANWFHEVDLTDVIVPNELLTQWSIQESELTTLGLGRSNLYTGENILVTAAVSQQVKEFTPNGNLVREVTVPNNISGPRQSIKVATDRYAVCHGYGPPPELHRVCLVNGNRETIKCYGGVSGSGDGQLDIPARLELSKEKCILVADAGNRRVRRKPPIRAKSDC